MAGEARFGPFAHVTADKAMTYRAVMRTFVRAKQRFNVHLRPEDVADALADDPEFAGPAPADVSKELNQLVEWGNLRGDPDTSRVTTVEDFLRSRFLYQLTPAGEAAETALAAYDEALGRRGELQAVALSDIRDQLRALLTLLDEPEPDEAKAHQLLRDLTAVFRGLADNAQAFMGSLQRTIDLHDADVEAFLAYKERLIDYLQRFIRDLVVTSAQIVATLQEIDTRDVGGLLQLVAERESRDAAPDLEPPPGRSGAEGGAVGDGGDSAGGDSGDGTDETDGVAEKRGAEAGAGGVAAVSGQTRLELWTDRWTGLRHWFVGDRHHPPQARLLRERARAAVPALLSVVGSINERRSGRSDRAGDFRVLARWFAQAADDTDAHRLWRACFGLTPARHLTIDQETLAERADNPVAPSVPWAQAPPVIVDVRLRRTGRTERRGAPMKIRDRDTERRVLAERLAAEEAVLAAARRRLATGRPTRLSELGELDDPEFRLFLSLLGDALSRRRPGQSEVRTASADGIFEIVLTETGDGRMATIRAEGGLLTGPDYVIEIHDLTAPALTEVWETV